MSEAGCAFTKRHSTSLVRLCMQGLSSCNLHDGTLVIIITTAIIIVVVVVVVVVVVFAAAVVRTNINAAIGRLIGSLYI